IPARAAQASRDKRTVTNRRRISLPRRTLSRRGKKRRAIQSIMQRTITSRRGATSRIVVSPLLPIVRQPNQVTGCLEDKGENVTFGDLHAVSRRLGFGLLERSRRAHFSFKRSAKAKSNVVQWKDNSHENRSLQARVAEFSNKVATSD